jgi:hypothetical protein
MAQNLPAGMWFFPFCPLPARASQWQAGLSRKEKEITNSARSASLTTLSVVEGEWVVHTHK